MANLLPKFVDNPYIDISTVFDYFLSPNLPGQFNIIYTSIGPLGSPIESVISVNPFLYIVSLDP